MINMLNIFLPYLTQYKSKRSPQKAKRSVEKAESSLTGVKSSTLNAPCISESCTEIKIKLNFYFHASLWRLKWFYEGL